MNLPLPEGSNMLNLLSFQSVLITAVTSQHHPAQMTAVIKSWTSTGNPAVRFDSCSHPVPTGGLMSPTNVLPL